MPTEFDLIRRHFRRVTTHTVLSVGDDAALIAPRPGMELAVSTDMLVCGVHFLPATDARALGWKALAVNLSDLAAMGAEPRWALLAAALPSADEDWIAAFAGGFFELAERSGVDVIGGDTTRGPLTLTPTVIGEVPRGKALRRGGARAGDDIWVSGHPGLAALGLAQFQGRTRLAESWRACCVEALLRPLPRVALGVALRGLAHAAIDVSDGLIADLGHVLDESGLAAELVEADLPICTIAQACTDAALVRECVLAGGDDYELLFTCDPSRRSAIEALGVSLDLPVTRIGLIVGGRPGGLILRGADGSPLPLGRRGFDHFA